MSGHDADIDNELPLEPAKAAQYLLYVIAALVVTTLVWAAVAKLDRVTRGEGRVVPSNHLQEVQYLEGGIVNEILVKPGQKVVKGDVLVRLDPTQMNAQFSQGQDGYQILAARIARLEAEASGEDLVFPERVAVAPQVLADERAFYNARLQEYLAARAVEEGKLADARATFDYATRAHSLASQEYSMIKPLVDKGIEPEIELVRARQRMASAEGEKQRAEIAVEGAQSELERIEKTRRAQAADELAKARTEMAGVSGQLPALRDKVDRTDVRAPINGIVNRVLIATLGGVVQPGQTIVEIVPEGETPLIEAKIKPADIGFLHVGQSARVKITAYDSSVFGALPGVIETISADAIEDPSNGQRHFLITVRTNDASFRARDRALPIMPGMAAQVDVLNGKRTVMAYLLKPLAEISGNALRED
ncbi:MAG: HlyD family type I secretion periplasmic adaptor subunit [Parvularculaceae bacterium]